MLKPIILIKGIFAPRLIPQAVLLFACFLLPGVCYAQQETNAQVQVRVFMEGLLKPIPEMVRVEAGMFNIGTEGSTGPQNTIWNNGTVETDSNQNFEGNCDQDNMNCMRPLVSIPQPFAVSRYEITREEFKFFLDSTTEEITPHDVWNDPRYYAQNADHPAAYVSWDDAKAYVRWLSAETRQDYRLLSETEWEYATRARTTSLYSFGDTITPDDANYNSQGTVSVGSYDANGFGLYDVHGNVWEWVEDCWHPNYRGLPEDGSAWEETSCNDQVLRGGAWDSTNESLLRSAQRGIGSQDLRVNNVGFRVAQMIRPRLTIANLTANTNIMLLHRGVETSPTDVEVVLNVDMGSSGTLTVTSDDESLVSASVDNPRINPVAGSTQTTVKFTLTPTPLRTGSAMVTISVLDNQGVINEVTIGVQVEFIEMVGVPKGTYTMGSPSDEADRDTNEGPQHSVTIPAFEVSRYEVTRGQFAVFAAANPEYTPDNDCSWQDPGFSQDDNHPVVCVSWDYAEAYVEWLSEETGQTYRLLSESEWEYVTRAGTTSTYFFGDMITTNDANYQDSGINGTVSIFNPDYAANGFGLYHAHGDAAEWVRDCWHSNYNGAPTDGSAWEDSCGSPVENRVIRGGSWDTPSADLRSAFRDRAMKDQFLDDVGFRVARMPLTIASPQDTSIRLFLDTSPTTQVQVVLRASDTTTPVTMTLQLASGGESVVSTTTLVPIIFPAVNDDSTARTASFTLLAEGIGETVLTIVVTNESGHEDAVQIRIEVGTNYPEMVQIKKGTYTMGSPPGEPGSTNAERPQHEVTVPGFEVGRYEVTRGQFAEFAADEGYTPNSSCNWQNPGFAQNNRHPVVCVSLGDAQAYVEWLSKETGQDYRLLSESEWEYVARAGTTTQYSIPNNGGFGSDTITQDNARYGASGTVDVGSYPANAFGLNDVHGNVWSG